MNPTCRCGRTLTSDNDLARGTCFGCHVRTVRFDTGPLKDRLYGEDLTNKQSQERIVEDARARGIEPEPVGNRWV